jgi:hypothetical protein
VTSSQAGTSCDPAAGLTGVEEEGEYEWASYNKDGEHSKEARIEPAVLYQPLGEAGSGELAEHGQPEHGGTTHDASGDGCGDGGYCGGHWVRRSEKGHRHGEPIGGNPWEPITAWCYLFPNPICNIGEKVSEAKR